MFGFLNRKLKRKRYLVEFGTEYCAGTVQLELTAVNRTSLKRKVRRMGGNRIVSLVELPDGGRRGLRRVLPPRDDDGFTCRHAVLQIAVLLLAIAVILAIVVGLAMRGAAP